MVTVIVCGCGTLPESLNVKTQVYAVVLPPLLVPTILDVPQAAKTPATIKQTENLTLFSPVVTPSFFPNRPFVPDRQPGPVAQLLSGQATTLKR